MSSNTKPILYSKTREKSGVSRLSRHGGHCAASIMYTWPKLTAPLHVSTSLISKAAIMFYVETVGGRDLINVCNWVYTQMNFDIHASTDVVWRVNTTSDKFYWRTKFSDEPNKGWLNIFSFYPLSCDWCIISIKVYYKMSIYLHTVLYIYWMFLIGF